MSGNSLFPVFIRPDKIKFLIVGGGFVGLEKIGYMFRHAPECRVRLVAPEIKTEIFELAEKYPTQIELIQEKFKKEHLEGIQAVIVGTAFNDLNREIHKIAKAENLFVNVADTPNLCDFYLSSVVKKGDLKIAISSNGKSPTLTKRVRELLEDVLPEEMDDLLQNLKEIRDSLKGDFEEKVKQLDDITSVMINKNKKQ